MAVLDPWARRWPVDRLPPAELALLPRLQEQMLAWQPRHGRHDLPWHTYDPYGVWVSEVMLQQTQVATGLYRYPAWMARFPTVQSLAQASEDDVLAAWEGLGYYSRARRLHAAARLIVERHAGRFPRDRDDRLALPGIGPSTASAIGAFAFGLREAIFDGNVARVWARWWGDRPLPPAASDRARFWWGWAQEATPPGAGVRVWTQGIMDLGATVCTPKAPRCPQCPWRESCRAWALGTPLAWPVKPPKAARKPWDIAWRWAQRDGRVAVRQRRGPGPWEGLWTLWESGEPDDPETPIPPIAQGRHDLSHRKIRWTIRADAAEHVPADAVWVTRAGFEALALPRPLRRWWTDLAEDQRQALFDPDEPPPAAAAPCP